MTEHPPQYIMVTNWKGHWDKLKKWNNSTIFTLPLIKDGLATGFWPAQASTLFIKLTTDNKFEKAWRGKASNFRNDPNNGNPAIRFDVSKLIEVDCPTEYKQLTSGWYLNKSVESAVISHPNKEDINGLAPDFFKQMSNCSWEQFEHHCYYLLKVIGIHDIHALPREAQHGRPDGFFRFNSLTVIYDATLETNFAKVKEQQIENYINQLKKEKIYFDKICYTIKDTHKQVWIITRGQGPQLLRTEDHVKVKEVPYKNLIDLYHKRMKEEVSSDILCDLLRDL